MNICALFRCGNSHWTTSWEVCSAPHGTLLQKFPSRPDDCSDSRRKMHIPWENSPSPAPSSTIPFPTAIDHAVNRNWNWPETIEFPLQVIKQFINQFHSAIIPSNYYCSMVLTANARPSSLSFFSPFQPTGTMTSSFFPPGGRHECTHHSLDSLSSRPPIIHSWKRLNLIPLKRA